MAWATATAVPAAAQTRARSGALVGGVIGATVTGGVGAVLAQGLCDAADCSLEWVDGAVTGAVLGGFAGAGLGAAFGALFPADPTSRASESDGRFHLAALVDGSAARGEWNSLDQTMYGGRMLVGLRRGGLLVGPSAEWLSGGGWRVSSVGLAGRIDPARGAIRPFLELGVGRYGWRHPAIVGHCAPGVPECTYSEETLTDHYVGVAGAVGVAVGDPGGAWRVFATVRYHYAPGRPTAEPFASTTTRQLRHLAVGAEIGLGPR